jgi:hypothetical protein
MVQDAFLRKKKTPSSKEHRTVNNTRRMKLKQLAKKLAGLAIIEIFVPGGTLILLGLLIAGGPIPAGPERVLTAFSRKLALFWRRPELTARPVDRLFRVPVPAESITR